MLFTLKAQMAFWFLLAQSKSFFVVTSGIFYFLLMRARLGLPRRLWLLAMTLRHYATERLTLQPLYDKKKYENIFGDTRLQRANRNAGSFGEICYGFKAHMFYV